jgi:hypothetical protein
MTDKMTAVQALGLLCSAIRCGEDFHEHCERASEIIRQALTAPRVPDGWCDFVRDVVESAEGYESRSGNKVNGDWVARGRALLTAAPAPADELATLRERVKVLEANYSELLYQVHEKIDGQTRHQTALARLAAHNNYYNAPEAARLRGGSDE